MSTVAPRSSNPRTREALLYALSRLLERKPLAAITVAEILSEAGHSSRTTFYRHFESRDEAFIALCEETLAEGRAIFETVFEDPQVRRSSEMRQATTLWMSRADRHRGLLFNILTEWPRVPRLKDLYLEFMDELIEIVARGIEEDGKAGHVISRLPASHLAAMTLWSAERAVYATLVGAEGFADSHAVADVLVGTHLGIIYGVDLPRSARNAGRAPWLTA